MINRGEIWWATLPRPRGSEPGARRPVLVISTDEFNHSAINTVLVVTLTSSTRRAEAPGNVLLKRAESGLPRASVVNVSQVATTDKRFLDKKVRRLPIPKLDEVEQGLRLVMDLQPS